MGACVPTLRGMYSEPFGIILGLQGLGSGCSCVGLWDCTQWDLELRVLGASIITKSMVLCP